MNHLTNTENFHTAFPLAVDIRNQFDDQVPVLYIVNQIDAAAPEQQIEVRLTQTDRNTYTWKAVLAAAEPQSIVFDPQDVTALHAFNGVLYVGTFDRGVYRKIGESYQQMNPAGLANPNVSCIIDYRGDIYVGTNGRGDGLYRFPAGSDQGELEAVPFDPKQITALYAYNDVLYMGTFDYGIFRKVDGAWQQMDPAGLANPNVACILGHNDDIYVGTNGRGDGLYRFPAGGSVGEVEAVPFDPKQTTVLHEHNGVLYLGTFDFGLFHKIDGTWRQMDAAGVANPNVACILGYGDDLYVGTNGRGHGLYRFRAHDAAGEPQDLEPSSILVSTLGIFGNSIFAGTQDRGLYYLDDHGWQRVDLDAVQDLHITGLLPFDAKLFVGTKTSGLFAANGPGGFNLALAFRPGTLRDDLRTGMNEIIREGLSTALPGNEVMVRGPIERRTDGALVWSCAFSKELTITPPAAGQAWQLAFRLRGVTAAPGAGSRSTQVEVTFGNLCLDADGPQLGFRRTAHLDILQNHGLGYAPLHFGVYGSNVLWNRAGHTNTLEMFLQGLGDRPVTFGADTEIDFTFRAGPQTSGPMNFGTQAEVEAIALNADDLNVAVANHSAGDDVLRVFTVTGFAAAGETRDLAFRRFSFSNMAISGEDGVAFVHVTVRNLRDQWDTEFQVPVTKQTGLEVIGDALLHGSARIHGAGEDHPVLSLGGHGDFRVDGPGVVAGRFVVKNDGNVGIGNADPQHKLDVIGNTVLRGDVGLDNARTEGHLGTGSRIDLFSSGKIENTNRARVAIEENWGLNLVGDESRPVKVRNADLHVERTVRIEGSGADSDAILSLAGEGELSVDAPFVHGGRFIVKNDGNVGIGNADPQHKLDVIGNTVLRGDVGLDNARTEGHLGTGSRIDLFSSGKIENTNRARVAIEENWGLNLVGDESRPVKVRNADLHVERTVRIEGSGADSDAILSLAGEGELSVDAPFVHGGRFIVKNDGNVGIGNADPQHKLDVIGNTVLRGDVGLDNARTEGHLGTGSRIDLFSSGKIENTNRARVAIEENWGLNLVGDESRPVKVRNADLNLDRSLHVERTVRIEGSGADSDAILSLAGEGELSVDAPFVHGGRFIVKNDGNVGIGRGDPERKLDVNGSTMIRGELGLRNATNSGHFGDGSRIDFLSSGESGGRAEVCIEENWGLNLRGKPSHPVKVRNANLHVDRMVRIESNEEEVALSLAGQGEFRVDAPGHSGGRLRVDNEGGIHAARGRYRDKAGDVMPTGTVLAFAGRSIPEGWIKCDGSYVPGECEDLINTIGARTPDLRGRILMGSDNLSARQNSPGAHLAYVGSSSGGFNPLDPFGSSGPSISKGPAPIEIVYIIKC